LRARDDDEHEYCGDGGPQQTHGASLLLVSPFD
jgi:hypothetical protein